MSMLDSFFNKGFKAAKCKTLLKLSIPRIKLLRNRREIQIKQMRRDIAKLLETGQEATARIRVEHIIREENMMAAQEIIELFCELISVRLPIIEAQRECPMDLKEAISSVCFAAPRCADLPELLQVQMLFAMKYGKEFVAAATELMPDCGVNRQLIELLSIRAPSPEKKLKLLKEIAEEHEIDWDPAASETELMKPHEDLLNGPTQFVSGSKMLLPKEKHDETLSFGPDVAQNEQPDLDAGFDPLDFPEVPRVSLRPSMTVASTPESSSEDPNVEHEPLKESAAYDRQESLLEGKDINTCPEDVVATPNEVHDVISGAKNEKQFLPFLAPPSVSPTSFAARPKSPPPSVSRTKSDVNVDLQDVLVAAQAAAETAERAAVAARSAASLAQARISEVTKRNSEKFPENVAENPFYADILEQPATCEKPQLGHQHSFGSPNGAGNYIGSQEPHKDEESSGLPNIPSFDKLQVADDSHTNDHAAVHSQPQRLPSMDDESYFAYPNLFSRQSSNLDSSAESVTENSSSAHGI